MVMAEGALSGTLRVETSPDRTHIRIDSLRAVLEHCRALPALPHELAEDLDRCIDTLSASVSVSTGDAARILGYGSINSVKSLVGRGLLPGAFRSRSGRWHMPLDSVMAARDFNLGGMRLPPATGNAFEENEPEV